jgi:hypothetical protein
LLDSFEDHGVEFLYFNWMVHFSDLHRTLSKREGSKLPLFKKVFENGNVPTNKEKRINIQKEITVCTPSLQKSLANSKAFGDKWTRTDQFSTKLKEEKIVNGRQTISFPRPTYPTIYHFQPIFMSSIYLFKKVR